MKTFLAILLTIAELIIFFNIIYGLGSLGQWIGKIFFGKNIVWMEGMAIILVLLLVTVFIFAVFFQFIIPVINENKKIIDNFRKWRGRN